MALYLAPIGSGLGDAIVSLPIIQWLLATAEAPVFLVARSERQLGLTERISKLAGTVRECDLPAVMQPCDRLINMRDHAMVRDFDWGSEKFAGQFPGFLINDIQRIICHDIGIFPDFSVAIPLTATKFESTQRKVLFVAGTTSDHKSWPVNHWLQLHEYLAERGIATAILGEINRSQTVSHLVASGVRHVETPTLNSAIDEVSNAALVVAVDTGLMHLAVQQGVQTIAIFNNLHTYLRPYSNCSPALAPRCQPECIPQHLDQPNWPTTYEWGWWDGKFEYCKAEPDKYCMNRIPVQQVFDLVMERLSGRPLAPLQTYQPRL